MHNVALDAIPDLSDTQVIVYSRWDRSPDILEDQVTYPIVSALLGAPRVRAVRGLTDFGYSFVYVIFETAPISIGLARARLEYLSAFWLACLKGLRRKSARTPRVSAGSSVCAARRFRHPHARRDAHAAGLVPALLPEAVSGVAEVAPIGGYGQQFQVMVDPNRLQAYGIPIGASVDAVRGGNADVGGA